MLSAVKVTSELAKAVAYVDAAAASIVKSVGSTNQLPKLPEIELVFTLIPLILISAPEVSIWPPLPSIPFASKVPKTFVTELEFLISDQATILPPAPLLNALAVIFELASISKYVACNKSPVPCQSPPTKIVPPPVWPSADIVAAFTSISFAVTSIAPPFEVSEFELNVPEIVAAPFAPASILIFLASIDPELAISLTTPFSVTNPLAFASSTLTTSSTTDWATSVFKVTIPFCVLILPSLLIEVWSLDGFTDTVKRLLSLILILTSSPAAKAVVTFDVMFPLLEIFGEISATYSALIFPWVVKLEEVLVEKLKLLLIKLSLVILSVDKIAPSALIAEVGPVKIPVGLTKINLPLEKIEPLIIEVPLNTLLSMLDLTPGWLKWTDALDPTLKVCQFIMPCSVLWSTFIRPSSGCVIWMLPRTTSPPVGSVLAPTSA